MSAKRKPTVRDCAGCRDDFYNHNRMGLNEGSGEPRCWNLSSAELAQARAERDALRADAERFRWIVDGGPYDGPIGQFNKAWREWDGSDNFRAALDATRAKETK